MMEGIALIASHNVRFTNSFNTNNPATDMKPLFLNDYEALMDVRCSL